MDERFVSLDIDNDIVSLSNFSVGFVNTVGATPVLVGSHNNSGCLVIGIERDARSIKNPPPTTVFEQGDIVWIVGEHEKVLRLSEGKTVK